MKSFRLTFPVIFLLALTASANAWADAHEETAKVLRAGKQVTDILNAPKSSVANVSGTAKKAGKTFRSGRLYKFGNALKKTLGKDISKGTGFIKGVVKNTKTIGVVGAVLGYAADAVEITGDMLKNGITKKNIKKSVKVIAGAVIATKGVAAAAAIGGVCGPLVVVCAGAALYVADKLKDKATDIAFDMVPDNKQNIEDDAQKIRLNEPQTRKRTLQERRNVQRRHGSSHTMTGRMSRVNVQRARETAAKKSREAEAKYKATLAESVKTASTEDTLQHFAELLGEATSGDNADFWSAIERFVMDDQAAIDAGIDVESDDYLWAKQETRQSWVNIKKGVNNGGNFLDEIIEEANRFNSKENKISRESMSHDLSELSGESINIDNLEGKGESALSTLRKIQKGAQRLQDEIQRQ